MYISCTEVWYKLSYTQVHHSPTLTQQAHESHKLNAQIHSIFLISFLQARKMFMVCGVREHAILTVQPLYTIPTDTHTHTQYAGARCSVEITDTNLPVLRLSTIFFTGFAPSAESRHIHVTVGHNLAPHSGQCREKYLILWKNCQDAIFLCLCSTVSIWRQGLPAWQTSRAQTAQYFGQLVQTRTSR